MVSGAVMRVLGLWPRGAAVLSHGWSKWGDRSHAFHPQTTSSGLFLDMSTGGDEDGGDGGGEGGGGATGAAAMAAAAVVVMMATTVRSTRRRPALGVSLIRLHMAMKMEATRSDARGQRAGQRAEGRGQRAEGRR